MRQDRIDRVLNELRIMGLSQMLISDPGAINYLTGINIYPHERFLALYISTSGELKIFLNNLFQDPEHEPIEKVWYSDTDNICEIVSRHIHSKKTLGVDKDLKARFLLPLIESNAAISVINSSFAVDITRGSKDSIERELMRKSSIINDTAMSHFRSLIHDGVTEKQISNQLLDIYKELGADGFSFDPIVSFGSNAADPHHEPDNTELKDGDCVLFDVGCIANGYCSDMTRTFFFKSADENARKVYNLVKTANETAESLIKPGVRLCEIDNAARSIITDAGYGREFNHRLGHFIGLEVHEFGDVSASSQWVARPGMIFSIEPGIYLKNNFGVRIEDLVLVTETGFERLNHYSKELDIID